MPTFAALALALLLAGCAGFAGRGLIPGQSTVAEVEAQMGPATELRPGSGGETVRFYSRQPNGRETYAARFGADGRLRAIEQRLTEANIARIRPGKSRAATVRDLLGPPYRVDAFERLARDIWTYKVQVGGYPPKDLFVQFSRDGIVREVLLIDDPEFSSMETP
jgi:hypothetical protein